MDIVSAEIKPSFRCWFCSASFTRHRSKQLHMRKVHGRICREQDINLLLHLQHLSEEPDCQDEWMFVKSRPIDVGEQHICPCGQNNIKSYYFLENKINGNRTFVGSTCIERIDPRVGEVIAYFQYLLTHPLQGTYVGDDGLQVFTVHSNTTLVRGADTIVQHLNPRVIRTEDGTCQVLVKYPTPETLVQGHTYELRLKAKYAQRLLSFPAV